MEKERVELGLPETLKFYHRGSYIEIVRRWWSWKILFFTGFVIVWDSFLVNWYVMIGGETSLIVILYPLLHVAVGVSLTYCVVASWLNKTHIHVGAGKMAVQHKPVPWFGNKELSTYDVKQLYSKEETSGSRKGKTVSYEVHLITHSGRNIKLIGGLDSSEQAFYIEQEIEKYLNIEDAPVKGEIGNTSS